MSNVVKLDPIRMSEISSATPSVSNPSTSKYTAPHLRTGDKAPEITSIVNDEKNFPTLGAVGKTSVSAWNKSSETSCIQKTCTPETQGGGLYENDRGRTNRRWLDDSFSKIQPSSRSPYKYF